MVPVDAATCAAVENAKALAGVRRLRLVFGWYATIALSVLTHPNVSDVRVDRTTAFDVPEGFRTTGLHKQDLSAIMLYLLVSGAGIWG